MNRSAGVHRGRVVTLDRARQIVALRSQILAALALATIVAGFVLRALAHPSAASVLWTGAVVVLAVELAVEVARTVIEERGLGVDTIALVAMVGAVALGQELAGLIIGLMFSGGAALESAASRRARRELTALVQRAPTVAQRRVDDHLEQVPVAVIAAGDVLVVRTGEVVPVDGAILSAKAILDMSALSGEPLPVTLSAGMGVLSGSTNAGPPFDVRAERPAAASAYAALVRLVEQAQGERSPFIRLADRYAGFFLPAALIAAGAAWALSGDAVRGLAVVVVATPCPLILAAPIALVSGVSRAARCGVVVKAPGVIEQLGQAQTVLFDKTGTLTIGTPEVREILTDEGTSADEILRLAASLDQLSAHVLGRALVCSAAEAGLHLALPFAVEETPGQGILGTVDGHAVVLGSRAFLRSAGIGDEDRPGPPALSTGSGEARIAVAVDGRLRGIIVMADEIRPDALDIVSRLHREGIGQVAMLSGDRRAVAERVGRALAIDRVYAEQTPEEKLAVVRRVAADPALGPVVMVGDGVNDAPALAAADVGIAMGAAGATVSSETADAVITIDRIDRVLDAIHIGRRALGIARQSVIVGMGLSLIAMAIAGAGYLPPVEGALLQEGIDLAVIVNALRALRG